ncbi:Dual specificity testis-specific protein kinase 2 [Dissophora globulifera]|nr:Dual specificity testis-specific protein kinase 2 [Dissophora globulifera]
MTEERFSEHSEFLGLGSYGKVEARYLDGTKVAVKTVRAPNSDFQKIQKEVKILSCLFHKHIIQYYDIEQRGEDLLIITECAKSTLDAAIDRLDWTDKKRIVMEVAEGLAYLHSQGIIHRDIKGVNILLTEDDQAKLCDFGSATMMAATISATSYSPTMAQRWIAPELLRVPAEYTYKSDVFALGAVMKDMIGKLDASMDAPPDYVALMHRCLDENPDNRPDAKDFKGIFDIHKPEKTGLPHGISLEEVVEPNLTEILARAAGVPQDDVKAAEFFQRAANQGHLKAQWSLGAMYLHGRGVKQEMSTAIEWWRKAAEQGDIEAQYTLACGYYKGDGIPRDIKESEKWFQEAASRGHVTSQCLLALMYFDGLGVPRDYPNAVKWFQKAADQGDKIAQSRLGFMYLKGDMGLPKHDAAAVKWFLKSAEQGYPYAQFFLGIAYARGHGIEKDGIKAMEWLLKCADQVSEFSARAKFNIGHLYLGGMGLPPDKTNAAKWFIAASTEGYVESDFELAKLRDD